MLESFPTQHDFTVHAVLPDGLDGVQFAVCPIDRVIHGVIDGECHGFANLRENQWLSLAAVHPGDLDLRLTAGIRPNDVAQLWIHGNGRWTLQTQGNQASAIPPVSLRDHDSTDLPLLRHVHLAPVQILSYPIDCQTRLLDVDRATANVQVLGKSNFGLSVLGIYHERALDRIVVSVYPVNVLVLRIVVHRLHALLAGDDVHLVLLGQIVRPDFRPVGEQQHGIVVLALAHAAVTVRKLEAAATRALVRAVEIRADLRALMLTFDALIDVLAVLAIVLCNYEAVVTCADVTAVGDVVTVVGAASLVVWRAELVVIWKIKQKNVLVYVKTRT